MSKAIIWQFWAIRQTQDANSFKDLDWAAKSGGGGERYLPTNASCSSWQQEDEYFVTFETHVYHQAQLRQKPHYQGLRNLHCFTVRAQQWPSRIPFPTWGCLLLWFHFLPKRDSRDSESHQLHLVLRDQSGAHPWARDTGGRDINHKVE